MTSLLNTAAPVGQARDSRAAVRPFVSVIVPVRNEQAFIGDTLGQLFRQDYPADRFEVLVADGRSTDRTREVIADFQRHHPHLRLLDNPRCWSSAGRNTAVQAARGSIVLLVDGHCEIDNPRYLHDLAEAFERSGADCVGRPQPLDVTGATALQRAVAAARSCRLGHHPASHIYSDREGFVAPDSVAVAYRRDVFERIGFFDESFDACEDVEFNHRIRRAGMTCFFTPKVRVRYHPRDTLPKLFRQMVRYGRGRVRLLRKHRDTFSLPGFIPAAFLAGVVLGPLFAAVWGVLWLVYLGTLGLYAALLLATGLKLAVQQREATFPVLVPLVLATVHLGAGWGICWEALRGAARPAAG